VTRYQPATSVEDAILLLAADPDGAKLISGGTALVLMMRHGLVQLDTLVAIGDLPELRGIALHDRVLRIGAATTLAEVAASPVVRTHAPALAEACGHVGNVRVRAVATLGGNVAEADFASDPPAALVCLDATCQVVGPRGHRTVAVADVIVGPYMTTLQTDEVLTGIDVPIRPRGSRQAYLRMTTRSSEDRPSAVAAARAIIESGVVVDLSVVTAASTTTPLRLPQTIAPALGAPLDAGRIDAIAAGYEEAMEAIDDLRASAWYRRRLTGVLVRRVLHSVGGQEATS